MGQRDQDGNLHFEASEPCVTVAKKSLCFSGPQFLKVKTACTTELCVKLLSQLLACGWLPHMGAICIIVRWGDMQGVKRWTARDFCRVDQLLSHRTQLTGAQLLSTLIIMCHCLDPREAPVGQK